MLKSEKGYRGLEFSVRRLNDGQWEWAVYPKKEEGARFAGCEENEQKAITACKANIDGWLAARQK
jgi:hypothetical protein